MSKATRQERKKRIHAEQQYSKLLRKQFLIEKNEARRFRISDYTKEKKNDQK